MNDVHFRNYVEAINRGRQNEASTQLNLFIQSFASFEQKERWTRDFLIQRKLNHRIRRDLYEHIVFPVLLKGYQSNSLRSLYWLARTINNLYGAQSLHKQVDYKSDRELLTDCYQADKSQSDVRLALLNCVVSYLNYITSEWPKRIIKVPGQTLRNHFAELRFARKLDQEQQYTVQLKSIEKKLNKARKRGRRKK